MANRLKPLNEEEQAVERIEGNGGVRAPSLVVGGLKDGDEASLERIHHLVVANIMPSPTSEAVEDEELISNSTMEKDAATKKYIENHYNKRMT
ncbi:hypothetical protein F2Q68_00022578 [Brassica cretica]|uniref:Uncharacterized protein n=1 Tax=Brassica cretica TaxID=69181 RepID=A0A8S9G1M2_BRACR|nr:hypothetical protein F2Q68_00022578 [Brassica cretica]